MKIAAHACFYHILEKRCVYVHCCYEMGFILTIEDENNPIPPPKKYLHEYPLQDTNNLEAKSCKIIIKMKNCLF